MNEYKESDICVTVHHCYNNINSQLVATITNFIDNYHQLNMFRAASSVHYTTSCKHSLVLLNMGETVARNMLS